MIYYPVIIPTLNRYEHFRRCIDSLSHNTHADKTELVIGLDYPPSERYREGYEKIKRYLEYDEIHGFAKVTIFKRKVNYGPQKNFQDLMNYVFKAYDAVISTEDDNIFSPCFLDFMDKVLNKYKDEPIYSSVSGYLHYVYRHNIKSPMLLTYDSSAWGTGLWKNKEKNRITLEGFRKILSSTRKSWKCFRRSPSSFKWLIFIAYNNNNWGDILRSNENAFLGHYQIRPSISLSRNYGFDGSGFICSKTTDEWKYEQQIISDTVTYDIGNSDPVLDNEIIKINKYLRMPHGRFARLKYLKETVIDYIHYRRYIRYSQRK